METLSWVTWVNQSLDAEEEDLSLISWLKSSYYDNFDIYNLCLYRETIRNLWGMFPRMIPDKESFCSKDKIMKHSSKEEMSVAIS